tara:strand:+ start:179 stop:505 length:327 start_codon:yes stop_codon:yes gene_type:complete
MNKFEVVLLFSPDLNTSTLTKEEDSFKKKLTDIEGKIIGHEDWGLRDLSYSINNNKKAFYKFYQAEVDGSKIPNFKLSLNQNEKLLRYLFIKVANHDDLPTKLAKKEN